MPDLNNKVVIITGASSGIGEATALTLADAGMKVMLVARRTERLDALAGKIAVAGGTALPYTADVSDRDQMAEMAKTALEAWGQIDVLVNNAGLMPLSYTKNLHLDEWERMIDVNIKGLLFATASVLPTMMDRKTGHVVNIGSIAGRRPFPSSAVYSGTKFAVRAITNGMRMELTHAYNIRFSDIQPGGTISELRDTITDPEVKEMFKQRSFRLLDAEDIAEAIRYTIMQPGHVNVAEVLVLPSAMQT